MQMKVSTLCVALGAAMGMAATPVMASAGGNAWVATATHAHPLAATASAKDLAEPGMPIHIEVALKLRDRAVLDAFIADAHNPHSATFGARLQPRDVLDDFAPSASQVQAVVDYLSRAGFTHIAVAPNRLLVSADGTAAGAQAAFATRLVHAHDSEGRPAYANIDDAKVPASLAGTVLSVLGLQTVSHAHTMIRTAGRPGSGGGTAGTITGHNPTTFPTIYGAAGTPTASTVTVGIISDGDMTQPLQDLASFTSKNGLPAVDTQVVVAGAAGTDTSGTAEWDLDSQDIVGMSGGVGKLVFYAATSLSNSALTTAYNRVVSDNQAKVVNVSLGECETYAYQDGSMAADDQIFSVAVAQGQTFSVSTGDDGSNECGGSPRGTTPSYPASSPYVIAVSGTTLGTGAANSWAGETLWSKSGGSPSTVEPKPSWQTQGGGTTRDVADVAFDGDPNSGAVIIVNGSNAQYGGTSLSAPLFAATWARMLAGHASLGFAGPYLYQAPAGVYHDVTSGSNGGETAAAGWDYASGFGSIILSNLDASL